MTLRTNTDLGRTWYKVPAITKPLISAGVALLLAIGFLVAGAALDHSIHQSYHAVRLNPDLLSPDNNSKDTTNLLVPVNGGLSMAPLPLTGPPTAVVSYWENDDTHAVSIERHRSGWGDVLRVLSLLSLLTCLGLLALAAWRLYEIARGTRAIPNTSAPITS